MKFAIPSPPEPVTRFEWIAIAALTLAGLVLRLLLWKTQSIVSVDGTDYIRIAREMAGGPHQPSVQPYGYPALILLFRAVTGDWILAARSVDLASGLALIPLTWALGRFFIRQTWLRLLPALAVAALPLTVRYSLTTMSESPYLALLLLMFLLVLSRKHLSGGLLGGLAFAVRPEALTAALVLALFQLPRRREFVRFLAGLALVVAPYVIVQGVHRGVWTLSGKTVNIAESHWLEREPKVGETVATDVQDRLRDHAADALAGYPRRMLVLGEELLRHGGQLVPLLGIAGLFGSGFILIGGVVQFLVTPIFAVGEHPRFVLPYLPFLWVLAAAFVGRLRPRWVPILGAVLCLTGFAATAAREQLAYRLNEDGIYPELVDAGKWLARSVGPETVVYDRKPYTAFYAGASYRAIPVGGYDEILDEIVRQGGDFLVLHEQVIRFFRPNLLPLILDKPVVWHETRLAPVYYDGRYLNGKTLIYRVVRPGGPTPLPEEATIKKVIGEIDHSPNHFLHGVMAMRAENWMAAAGEFDYVLREDPENAAALNNRAWCLLEANQHLTEAQGAARKAVALEPGNPDYIDTLIRAYRALGADESVEFWQERLDALEVESQNK